MLLVFVENSLGTAGRKGWIVGSGMAGDQRNTVGAIIVKLK
jgi:hypothetical protein